MQIIDLEFEQGKRESPSLITKSRKQAAEQESRVDAKPNSQFQDKFSATRKETEKIYGKIARALSKGDSGDKALALQMVDFVKQMPPVATKHQQLVNDLRAEEIHKQYLLIMD